VKPAPFRYADPGTLDEALAVLSEEGEGAKVLAGGQSLLPLLSMRLAAPATLVDINRVPGLDTVEATGDGVTVGALVRQNHLLHDAAAARVQPLLARATANVAHPAIRNRGTTVGSIAHADPAGEMPAVLALTAGIVEVAGPRGRREIPCHDFFLGALETSLAPDELAVAVRFPLIGAHTGTAFAERARRHGDYALAGVAAAVTVDDGVVSSARLSFVSVTDVPGALDVTEAVRGLEPEEVDWSACDDLVREHLAPEDDIHATAEYRAMLATRLTHLTLAEAATDAVALQSGSGPRHREHGAVGVPREGGPAA
jgi:aerobic carbon-monoxide dehydrogenase medium subunit